MRADTPELFERPPKQPPHATPRPAEELEGLKKAWETPKGWRLVTAVNNVYVGIWYVGDGLRLSSFWPASSR